MKKTDQIASKKVVIYATKILELIITIKIL